MAARWVGEGRRSKTILSFPTGDVAPVFVRNGFVDGFLDGYDEAQRAFIGSSHLSRASSSPGRLVSLDALPSDRDDTGENPSNDGFTSTPTSRSAAESAVDTDWKCLAHGLCTCSFFSSKKGCERGDNCQFCHQCAHEVALVKARSDRKQTRLRKRDLARTAKSA